MTAVAWTLALGALLAGGSLAWLLRHRPAWAASAGSGSACLSAGLGLAASLPALQPERVFQCDLPWAMPDAALSLGIDPLSGFFLSVLFGVSGCAALFGWGYLRPEKHGARIGSHWFFFNLLVASMAAVLLARNALLFIVAWELMTLSSYFLVVQSHEDENVRRAGWLYLIASHIGVFCLLAFFALVGRTGGGYEFARLAGKLPVAYSWLFLLALAGFGLKAGLVPLHVWLPEAHPAAPSHVSALMSAVMIKLGIYGLLRILTFFDVVPPWWGGVLIGLGIVSGVFGAAFALAQHDLKRLLAYSSVENVGIIALGLGLVLLGRAWLIPALTAVGAMGLVLHVLNHAGFKALLFFSAGAAARGMGSRNLNMGGGLIKRMPATGVFFFIGAAAAGGLPPFGGFVGEWVVYSAAFMGITQVPIHWNLWAIAALAGLAAMGGLALAAMAKAFGALFLGEARTPEAGNARETTWPLLAPMAALAAACLAAGLLGPWLCLKLQPVAIAIAGQQHPEALAALRQTAGWLRYLTAAGAALLVLAGLLAGLRNRRLRGEAAYGPTWDCGYEAPTARMQYTAASFSQPLARSLSVWLRPQVEAQLPAGHFPQQASWQTRVSDLFQRQLLEPLFRGAAAGLAWLRWLQQGRIQLYVLYIAAALILLVLWGWL